jgi:hypothetical protein
MALWSVKEGENDAIILITDMYLQDIEFYNLLQKNKYDISLKTRRIYNKLSEYHVPPKWAILWKFYWLFI